MIESSKRSREPSRIARDQKDWPKVLQAARQLAESIHNINRPDNPSEMGALKQMKIPAGQEGAQASKRFRAEVDALQQLRDEPGILRLLDFDADAGWMVTELHRNGTLESKVGMFAGDAIGALRAFRPLVAAVARLHKLQVVHRDIKPANLFIDQTGRGLILGDFGIVFWANEKKDRMTDTFERVGSRDWMAPWAHTGRRIEDVNASFDVFPLGKILWSMISGLRVLPFWNWKKPDYNLEHLFPADQAMFWINSRILAHTIVEDESDCVPDTNDLLARVDAIINLLQRGGQRTKVGVSRPCRICGIGEYTDFRKGQPQVIGALPSTQVETLRSDGSIYERPERRMTIRVQVCNSCGHMDVFHLADGNEPPSWTAKD